MTGMEIAILAGLALMMIIGLALMETGALRDLDLARALFTSAAGFISFFIVFWFVSGLMYPNSGLDRVWAGELMAAIFALSITALEGRGRVIAPALFAVLIALGAGLLALAFDRGIGAIHFSQTDLAIAAGTSALVGSVVAGARRSIPWKSHESRRNAALLAGLGAIGFSASFALLVHLPTDLPLSALFMPALGGLSAGAALLALNIVMGRPLPSVAGLGAGLAGVIAASGLDPGYEVTGTLIGLGCGVAAFAAGYLLLRAAIDDASGAIAALVAGVPAGAAIAYLAAGIPPLMEFQRHAAVFLLTGLVGLIAAILVQLTFGLRRPSPE